MNTNYNEEYICSNFDILTKKYIDNGSFAFSMNRYYIKRKISPKLLFVGTLTPEAGKGYYYTAIDSNKKGNKTKYNIYNYINEAEIGVKINVEDINNLESLPNEELDIDSPSNRMDSYQISKNKVCIEKIRKLLNKKGIYFFDVFSCAVRKKHNDPADSNIVYASIDYDSFSKIDISNCLIIVNSAVALETLIKIIEKVYPEYTGKIACVPQMARSYQKKYNNFGSAKLNEAWADMIGFGFGKKIKYKELEKFIIPYSKNAKWPYKNSRSK